ncbi:MAG: hypothetical protein HY738_13500 [Bacteroidia bacterium]|nr:hypothetical protein [Bacteroidia bacterium]
MLLLILTKHSFIYAQEKTQVLTLAGYMSNMQSVMFQDIKDYWIMDNIIHNRLNFDWRISKAFSASLQMRNRIIYGDRVKFDTSSAYAAIIDFDRGIIDLSENWVEEKSVLINSAIDRLLLTFEKGKLNIMAGRQRINWGQTFVWNPNDIFNSYSFLILTMLNALAAML